MRYLGGKTKVGSRIATYLSTIRGEGQMYYEPFVGACGVFHRMDNPREGSDISKDLILMLNALLTGWIPPKSISKETYTNLKKMPPSPLRAFAGFGCSFSGNWFSGYATGSRNFAGEARNSLLSMRSLLEGAVFLHRDYRDLTPESDSLIYCDPPYPYNLGYSAAGELDQPVFWDQVREWSKHCTVIVSGYACPGDFKTVLEIETLSGTRSKGQEMKTRTEKLFAVKSSV